MAKLWGLGGKEPTNDVYDEMTYDIRVFTPPYIYIIKKIYTYTPIFIYSFFPIYNIPHIKRHKRHIDREKLKE